MMVYDNGSYRQATAEEITAWETIPSPNDDTAILNILMGGEAE